MDKYEQQKELQNAITLAIWCLKRSREQENDRDNPDPNLIIKHDNAIRTLQTFVETTK